jgi:Transposase DDE domain
MVIPPRTAATPDRTDTRRGRARPRIGSAARPRRTTRVALPLPEPPPKAAELPVDILPPELALVRALLPPDFQLPPEVLAAMVLPSVPLANATLTTWSYLLHPQFLDDFYAAHRGRCYEDLLTFPAIVALTRDSLVLHKGSALPALERAAERGEMPTCQEAYYAKLRRIPPELSEAFVAEATARLAPLLLPASPRADALPASVGELEVICLDGKPIKRVAKRLKPARGRPGKLIGGKVLVAYLPRTGLAVAMAAERDGEANDIRLMPRAVPLARERTTGPRLWVADRQFGDLNQPALLSEEDDHFLLRRSLKLSFAADPDRPARESADARGLRVVEQWGWIGAVSQGPRRRYVRQIHLIRPGAEDVYLVTDLLDEARYPAADLLEVYLRRWEIERVFQKIVEVFHLEHLIGSTPEATIFQAAFCLVLYNLLQVMRGYMAAGQAGLAADEVSMEKLFDDVAKELTALVVLFPSATIAGWFAGEWSAEEVARRLGQLLGGAWKERYRKAINKKPRPKVKKAKGSGAHTSVQKLRDADRKKRRESEGVP